MVDAFTLYVLNEEHYLGSRANKINQIIQELQNFPEEIISEQDFNNIVRKYHIGKITNEEMRYIQNSLKDF